MCVYGKYHPLAIMRSLQTLRVRLNANAAFASSSLRTTCNQTTALLPTSANLRAATAKSYSNLAKLSTRPPCARATASHLNVNKQSDHQKTARRMSTNHTLTTGWSLSRDLSSKLCGSKRERSDAVVRLLAVQTRTDELTSKSFLLTQF